MSVSRPGSRASRWTIEAWLLAGLIAVVGVSLPVIGWQTVAAEVEQIRSRHPAFDQTIHFESCSVRKMACRSQSRLCGRNRHDSDIVCDEVFRWREPVESHRASND